MRLQLDACIYTRVQLDTCIKYTCPTGEIIQLATMSRRHVANWTRVYSTGYCRHASNCKVFVVYLQCVVKDALRLHPPTPLMLPHRANANVKVGGYDVPKETSVHVNVWAIARDLGVWKNPLEFCPGQFLEEDVDMKGHDSWLLPFGAGRRMCPVPNFLLIWSRSCLVTYCTILFGHHLKGSRRKRLIYPNL
jgi:hypothetical protein